MLVSVKLAAHQQIVMDFDKAIAEMKADGTYDKMIKLHGL
jgi:polar amino acid transport system substrate-binding protein